jgi:UDP-N-acetylmuramyl tripeptide synthase
MENPFVRHHRNAFIQRPEKVAERVILAFAGGADNDETLPSAAAAISYRLGEIVRVLHENPRPTDIDGIKRRTRSGMGRCQGGFCAPVVAEIIARETGIPYAEVTKFGGASRLNLAALGEEDAK